MPYYGRPLESGHRRKGNAPLNELDKKDGFCSSFNGRSGFGNLNRYFVVEQNPLILILDRDRLENYDGKLFLIEIINPFLICTDNELDDITGIGRLIFKKHSIGTVHKNRRMPRKSGKEKEIRL